jgi:prepilin-type N-terminal cleavage/methylation domain-containing protein
MTEMNVGISKRPNKQAGFSIVELLVVVAIIAVMASVAIFYVTAHKKAYQADEQALQIADILQEARQRSLTQRRTMRVEINLTTNKVKLYDENVDANSASDDIQLRSLSLFASTNVRVDVRPSEIGYNPAETLPVPNAIFKSSVYTPSVGQTVCTIRFLANGTVVDAGTNATGAGAVSTGVTLHIWMPSKANPAQSDIARSITVLGATGVIRFWEFDHQSALSNKWKDSHRASSFG